VPGPQIDWDLVLLMEPPTLIGAIAGEQDSLRIPGMAEHSEWRYFPSWGVLAGAARVDRASTSRQQPGLSGSAVLTGMAP
jgi:hypothetical protein